MDIPGLGKVAKDPQFNWHRSEPLAVPVLDGKVCRIIVEGYEEDPAKEDFHTAIANFLSISPSALKGAEPHLFAYYQSCAEDVDPEDIEEELFPDIQSPGQVWDHIQFGSEPLVTRRPHKEKGVYISLECGCDWEEEHGLQIVFKNGERVNKVGPYNGHLTWSDTYADDRFEDVIYR